MSNSLVRIEERGIFTMSKEDNNKVVTLKQRRIMATFMEQETISFLMYNTEEVVEMTVREVVEDDKNNLTLLVVESGNNEEFMCLDEEFVLYNREEMESWLKGEKPITLALGVMFDEEDERSRLIDEIADMIGDLSFDSLKKIKRLASELKKED